MANDAEEELFARRGDDAKRLINDPIFRQAIAAIEADIVREMKDLSPRDLEGRDALWRELRAMSRFKIKVRQYVNRGEQAKTTLLQRAKDFIRG